MLCMEKPIETMEKTIETMESSMKTMEKSMKTLGKSMNTMEKSSKTMENWWAVQMANFSSKIQQSICYCAKMQQIARKSAPDWKTKKYAPLFSSFPTLICLVSTQGPVRFGYVEACLSLRYSGHCFYNSAHITDRPTYY